MKKFLFILILIVSAILPTACSCGKEEPTISATRTEVSMAINQTLNIDSLITITGTDNDCEYVISNISVLKIEDGVIKPLTAGRADIKCKIIGYDENFVVIKVTVRDVKLAHTVSIPKDEIIINIGSGKSAVNKPIFNEEVTEIPNIICDTNIAGYDYATGTVTARAEGETVVRIVYELCEVEFKVIVQKIVFVTNMFVENARLYVGDTGTFDYDVYPTNGNQFRFYEGSDSLEVDSYGVFVAKSPDTVTVYCEYFSEADSDPKVVEFTVEIFDLPDNLDEWQLPDWVLPDDYERYLSEELSRFATYENFDHDITAQLRFIREKYNMNVGLTLLPQRSKMNYQYMGHDIDTVRTVFNFTPTMNFRYRWTKQRNIQVNYRGRSSQPSMTDLLPITDDSNPLNITMGNPGLKPTFNNSLNVRFRDFNVERLQNISANVDNTTRNYNRR